MDLPIQSLTYIQKGGGGGGGSGGLENYESVTLSVDSGYRASVNVPKV